MTLSVYIGRRVPRAWFKRQAGKVRGLVTFQENIWHMINNSMSMAMRKCNASGKGKWIQTKETEIEDMHYQIEWLKIIVQGSKEFEEGEYEEVKNFYKPFGEVFKNELNIPTNNPMKHQIKTKILSQAKVDEAYKVGFGSVSDNNISNKLLEMGILTVIDYIEDYDGRDLRFVDL